MAESEERLGVDDVEVVEVWNRLEADSSALLIDVRTQAEWAFVGLPDLSAVGKQLIAIEWQMFPGGQLNPSFSDQLSSELNKLGAGANTDLFFLCRSGSRSLAVAQAMAAAGYRACNNVAGGFEGPPDGQRHRGSIAGWKAAGLPWRQG